MFLSFGGTRTFHRLACAIEDAGLEIRDCLMWLYGSGFPKSLDISKAIDKAAGAEREVVGISSVTGARSGSVIDDGNGYTPGRSFQNSEPVENFATAPSTDAAKLWNGWGTALKPAWEPIIMAMKAVDGTFAENAQAHCVAGLNIDGGRIGTDESTARPDSKCKYGNGVDASHSMNHNFQGGDGFISGGNPMGRFPANLLLDEDAAELLDLQTGPQTSGGTPIRRPGVAAKTKNAFGDFAGEENPNGIAGSSGAVSRFFYTAKASRSERGKTNKHPTVKPLDLMRYLCRLTSTPTGGRVLDPFAGSGSTLIAAYQEGRPAVGIELDKEHCGYAIDRLKAAMAQGRIKFDEC
jgi:site-specific DNA-methyltransferase (adenine-specific)